MSPRVAKPAPKPCRHQWGIWLNDTVPHDPMPIDGPMWEWCRRCHKVRKPKIVKPAPEVQVQPLAERSLVEDQGAPLITPLEVLQITPLAERPAYRTKCTPEARKAILQALEVGGISLTKAAQAAGIHRDTIYQWIKDDPTLSDDIYVAQGRAVLRNAANLATAARRDVRAMLALAERADPEYWEPRPIRIDLRVIAARVATELGLSDNEAEAIVEEMKRLNEPEAEC